MTISKAVFSVLQIILLFCSITVVNSQNIDINLLRDINLNRNTNLDPAFKFVTNSVTPLSIGTPILLYTIGSIKKDSTIKKKAILLGKLS